MTTFEGGALAIADPEIADRVERLSLHGLTRSSWARHGDIAAADYDVPEPGFKYAMHDVSAAVGSTSSEAGRLDRAPARARRPLRRPPHPPAARAPRAPPAGARHAHHIYVVRLSAEAGGERDPSAASCAISASAPPCTSTRSTCTRTTAGARAGAPGPAGGRGLVGARPDPAAVPRDDARDVEDVARALEDFSRDIAASARPALSACWWLPRRRPPSRAQAEEAAGSIKAIWGPNTILDGSRRSPSTRASA